MNPQLTLLLGRGLVALAFIGPGGMHLFDSLRQRDVSAAAAFAALEVAAGLAVLLGWQLRWVALGLAVFLLVDAFAAHAFWNAVSSDQRNQLLHFFKNVALAGTFLILSSPR